jgi:hypothetical protein
MNYIIDNIVVTSQQSDNKIQNTAIRNSRHHIKYIVRKEKYHGSTLKINFRRDAR